MAKRFFVCPVIGSGARRDPYRVSVADYGIPYTSILPTDASGAPRFNWSIAYLSGADFTALDADNAIAGLPAVTVDTKLQAIPSATRNKFQNWLTSHGVDLTGITLQSTIGDVLDRVRDRLGADWRGLNLP